MIGAALGWKHNHTEGIATVDGVITQWPASLGAMPTDAEQAAIIAEYEVYKAAMDEIERLETVPRRIRENLISLGTEDQVVIDEDAAIAEQRKLL